VAGSRNIKPVCPLNTSLDIRAWSDRVVFEWTIELREPLDGVEASFVFQSGPLDVSENAVFEPGSTRLQMLLAFHIKDGKLAAGLPEAGDVIVSTGESGTVEFSERSAKSDQISPWWKSPRRRPTGDWL
jgi:hypothetical protein